MSSPRARCRYYFTYKTDGHRETTLSISAVNHLLKLGHPSAHISPIATSASRDFLVPLIVGRVTPDGPSGILEEETVFLLGDTIWHRSRYTDGVHVLRRSNSISSGWCWVFHSSVCLRHLFTRHLLSWFHVLLQGLSSPRRQQRNPCGGSQN